MRGSVRVRTRLDLRRGKRLAAALRAQVNGGPGPVAMGFRNAGADYLRFSRHRFRRLSGSGWARLGWETLAVRRIRGNLSTLPLQDTGQMLMALNPGANGNLMTRISGGLRVGYGGGSYRKPAGDLWRSQSVSIGKLAEMHYQGFSAKFPISGMVKKVPARGPLGMPDGPTQTQMKNSIGVGVRQFLLTFR